MEKENIKGIIEAMIFAAGRAITINELVINLELSKDEIKNVITEMQEEYSKESRGIELIKADESYQLCTKKELYNSIYPIIDKRAKPNLSNAALETLAIIAYNPRIIRAQIEAIRGVSADGCIYKLLEYGLIEEAGKLDAPGKPMSYKTSDEFLKMFGYTSLNDLPELPKYKLDENRQIVIDELIEEKEGKTEAPMPEKEELEETKKEEKL